MVEVKAEDMEVVEAQVGVGALVVVEATAAEEVMEEEVIQLIITITYQKQDMEETVLVEEVMEEGTPAQEEVFEILWLDAQLI